MRKCFISYSHKDAAFVEMLARLLVHASDSLEIFVDRTHREPGTPLPDTLRAALDAADVLLPCVSAASVASTWCTRERQWFMDGRPARQILPLRLVPYDSHQSDEGWYPDYVGVDFADWVRRGDLILFGQVLPALVPERPAAGPRRLAFDGTRGPALAADVIEVLGGARRFEAPREIDAALVQMAITLAQSDTMSSTARNALALAVAGNFVQRGDWQALKAWALEAEAEASDDADALCQFHQFLGLAERRLGRPQVAAAHLEGALDRARTLAPADLRLRTTGQIRREQGTLALGLGNLSAARLHYRESREALADYPSERAHVAQTWVKTAQIELVVGDAEAAAECLSRASSLLALESDPTGGQSGSAQTPSLIHAARVAAHQAKTRALTEYLRGDLPAARRAVDEHAGIIAPHDWQNERAQSRRLTRLLAVGGLLPVAVRQTLVRLAISTESAGRAPGAWLRAAMGQFDERGG